ncbi:MAG: zinc-ribbon domain-containing protein [Pyrinomonadaceae bacterium]|nr:zinc-ribbon domain-containing protein [Pyrinomonadaceae bacterium]
MIINCPQCSARLVLEDSKLPSRQFRVCCPKCQHNFDAQPPAAPIPALDPRRAAITIGDVEFTSQTRYQRPAAAPAFRLEPPPGAEETGAPAVPGADELARALAAFLQQSMTSAGGVAAAAGGAMSVKPVGVKDQNGGNSHHRALVCADVESRYAAARVLVEGGYEVFVAEDTAQAIERMRADHMDVVILDPAFDLEEKGAAFIRREISSLRPGLRRRTFYVHLAADLRTGDPHAAFINHANFILNPADVEDLPDLLERAFREFNELYQDFNHAAQAAGI